MHDAILCYKLYNSASISGKTSVCCFTDYPDHFNTNFERGDEASFDPSVSIYLIILEYHFDSLNVHNELVCCTEQLLVFIAKIILAKSLLTCWNDWILVQQWILLSITTLVSYSSLFRLLLLKNCLGYSLKSWIWSHQSTLIANVMKI